MQFSNIEQKFIDKLSVNNQEDVKIERNEYGILTVYKTCPCEEIGYLSIYIEPEQITFSYKITHIHFELSDYKRRQSEDPLMQMIDESIQAFQDFINGQIVLSLETDPKGRTIGAGWRNINTPLIVNKEYETLMRNQYGGSTTIKEWTWNGPL